MDTQNILPQIEKIFPKNIKMPEMAESLSKLEEEDYIDYALEGAKNIWGSDCLGGIAYFGKTENMKDILKQTKEYFEKMNSKHAENQFYLFWNLGDYSLLNLYEDYQASVDNPYPVNDNVLSILFGAWCDDDKLNKVLKDKKYLEDQWSFGGGNVNLDDPKQKELLENMKNAISTIKKSKVEKKAIKP